MAGDGISPDPALSCALVPIHSWGHGEHWHHCGQLLAAVAGDVVVRLASGAERHVTPDNALWIPAHVVHAVRMSDDAVLLPVMTEDPSFDARMPPHIAGVTMTPALRKAVTRQVRSQLIHARESYLGDILAASATSLEAGACPALPRSRAAREVAQRLCEDPASHVSLAAWADQTFVSEATLRRAFLDETGMPFSEWLRRMRLAASGPLLDQGVPVAKVASRIGYASASAFIASYKRQYGRTPRAS